MARKGVLVSSPDVQNMTPLQWLFEYHAIQKKENDTFHATFKAIKGLMVNVFGLNALKPVDESGLPKKYEDMSDDEREAFLPLVAWIARPEMLKEVVDQIKLENSMSTSTTDTEYQKMVDAIDAAGGDMEPVLGPVPDNLPSKLAKMPKGIIQEYPDKETESASVILDVDPKDI